MGVPFRWFCFTCSFTLVGTMVVIGTTTHVCFPIMSGAPTCPCVMRAQTTNEAFNFAQQLRAAKSALKRGLKAEAGEMSEDAMALVEGLERVNPSAPDPTSDTEFWTGSFDVLTALASPLLHEHELSQTGARVAVAEDQLSLTVDLQTSSPDVGLAIAQIAAQVTLEVVDDTMFALAVQSLRVVPASTAVCAPASAMTLLRRLLPTAELLVGSDSDMSTSDLPQLMATVFFLDQDFVIVQVVRSDAGADEAAPSLVSGLGFVVLSRTKKAVE